MWQWCVFRISHDDLMAYSIVFHKMLGRMCYCINYQWNYWKHMAIRPFLLAHTFQSCNRRDPLQVREAYQAALNEAGTGTTSGPGSTGPNTWMEHFRILAAVGCVDRAWLLKIGIRISLKGPRFLQPICNLPFVQDVRVSFVHVGKFLACAHSSSACFRHA